MMQESIPFRLFTCCLPVQGAERALICDIQRESCQMIPSSLFEILTKYDGKTINEVKLAYENEYDETIDEYFEILEREEYIFFTEIGRAHV